MLRWYVVHTKRAAEAVAEANLIRQGYEVYLPLLARMARHRGRRREEIVALFPRYLFVAVHEASQSLAPVRSTVGVSNVVRFGQQYAAIPAAVIAYLRDREDAESGLHRLCSPAMPAPGTCVTLLDGPFGGLQGIFTRESGPDRVIVLLNLLGTETRVTVPVESLLPSLPVRAL